MSRVVTVTTGARLHFGLVVAAGAQGVEFASVGAMICEPGFQLRMAAAPPHDVLVAPSQVSQRIAEFLAVYRRQRPAPPVQIEVAHSIPEHAGLGSGTQLALAVGTALSALFAAPDDAAAVPKLLGRGRRSSIGVHGFRNGGMHAHGFGDSASERHRRGDLPPEWRFVLVTPPHQQGLSGSAEFQAFQHMASMPSELCRRLEHCVCAEWWAALERQDFAAFAEAMYIFGQTVGAYFAPYQGGTFAHPQMAALVQHVRETGRAGVAQTSWGPTIVVLCADQSEAERVRAEISSDRRWCDCTVRITAGLNRGATVTVE